MENLWVAFLAFSIIPLQTKHLFFCYLNGENNFKTWA